MNESPPYMPTFYPEDANEELPEDIYDKDLHQFSDPTITYTDAVKV